MEYTILVLVVITLLASATILIHRLTSTRREVMLLLKKHNVPLDRWEDNVGQENLNRLIKSVEDGEIDMESRPDGVLVLHVHVAVATLLHRNKKFLYELREYRKKSPADPLQPRRFSGSLGGKIRRRRGETAQLAIQREIGEELGDSEPRFKDPSEYELEYVGPEITAPQPSDYGRIGLIDVYHREHFRGEVNGLYRHSYVEKSSSGETKQFFWVRV